jgi:tetratricopeptide (TPR) repeat protein
MLLLKLICFITAIVSGFSGRFSTPEELLELGDNALSSDDVTTAIKFYLRGIEGIDDDESILTALSLYTNLGTSYSSMGEEVKAIEMYRNAILYYSDTIGEIVDKTILKSASDLAAQTSFFLGLSHQEIGNSQKAVDAYAYANTLDPFHWASLANLGSVLHDNLKEPADALAVYNKAFHILTQTEVEPTDVPEDPKLILSQLQYRIGLCITYSENQKCVMQDDPTKEVACTEMAANAFSQAIELDPENEIAKHMLATVTADASMSRASNAYVTKLFEDYAEE